MGKDKKNLEDEDFEEVAESEEDEEDEDDEEEKDEIDEELKEEEIEVFEEAQDFSFSNNLVTNKNLKKKKKLEEELNEDIDEKASEDEVEEKDEEEKYGVIKRDERDNKYEGSLAKTSGFYGSSMVGEDIYGGKNNESFYSNGKQEEQRNLYTDTKLMYSDGRAGSENGNGFYNSKQDNKEQKDRDWVSSFRSKSELEEKSRRVKKSSMQ